MDKRTQILVIGHNESGCTANHEKIAYDTGAKIAQSGAILVTGGLGGVMQFSCMGAKEAGGITVGVLPQDKRGEENEFCSVVIPTGMGYARDFINALSADAVIIIGGGAGTLSEMCAAYMYERPMVAIAVPVEWQMSMMENTWTIGKNDFKFCSTSLTQSRI